MGDTVAVEKAESQHVDETQKERIPTLDTYDAKEVARVVRKLDLCLMPLLFTLYTFSVLDRSNLGNAKLAGLKLRAGLEDDINVEGERYELLGIVFYIGYIVFQFTSIGWKLFKPHIWVSCVVLGWGTISTLQATAYNWGGLIACRFLLGVVETMFGPGVPLYLSFFYPRQYVGLRFGIFLSGAALANAYGGALAYGLSHINSSISNWRFLFIVEGVPTALLAVVCWFYIPDRPEKARFFNAGEREIAQAFAQSQPGSFEKPAFSPRELLDALKDYKNWIFAMINFSTNVSFASLPLFLPTIINDLGAFNELTSNGLSAPPYLLCFFVIIGTAFASDKFRIRGPFACFFACIATVGYLVLALTTGVAPRYVGIFLVVLIFTTVAIVLIWNANSNETESKRAGGVWLIQCVGQCGTLLGTHSFPDGDSPLYRRGMWTGFAFSLAAAAGCATLSVLFWRENRRRDRIYGKVEAVGGPESLGGGGLPAEARFRYII